MMTRRDWMITGIGLASLAVLLLAGWALSARLQANISSEQEEETAGEQYGEVATCRTSGNPDNAAFAEGQLVVTEENGRVTGWECIFQSQNVCHAEADGVWDTCTFDPTFQPWPMNVERRYLDNPAAARRRDPLEGFSSSGR